MPELDKESKITNKTNPNALFKEGVIATIACIGCPLVLLNTPLILLLNLML